MVDGLIGVDHGFLRYTASFIDGQEGFMVWHFAELKIFYGNS
jgi:hypothetical protein